MSKNGKATDQSKQPEPRTGRKEGPWKPLPLGFPGKSGSSGDRK